jgi:hypothetical protein
MWLMIGSVHSGSVSTMIDSRRGSEAKAAEAPRTIADHVAEADAQEPIRNASETQGTLVDTYL